MITEKRKISCFFKNSERQRDVQSTYKQWKVRWLDKRNNQINNWPDSSRFKFASINVFSDNITCRRNVCLLYTSDAADE